ncbi:hypothetical protein DENSPDRAFT_498053 [Dentipellis sp. KUC8613]|nr:hypothetical protein DENSPDRAFT_498053 [Dentipellis sp. KUC8613]
MSPTHAGRRAPPPLDDLELYLPSLHHHRPPAAPAAPPNNSHQDAEYDIRYSVFGIWYTACSPGDHVQWSPLRLNRRSSEKPQGVGCGCGENRAGRDQDRIGGFLLPASCFLRPASSSIRPRGLTLSLGVLGLQCRGLLHTWCRPVPCLVPPASMSAPGYSAVVPPHFLLWCHWPLALGAVSAYVSASGLPVPRALYPVPRVPCCILSTGAGALPILRRMLIRYQCQCHTLGYGPPLRAAMGAPRMSAVGWWCGWPSAGIVAARPRHPCLGSWVLGSSPYYCMPCHAAGASAAPHDSALGVAPFLLHAMGVSRAWPAITSRTCRGPPLSEVCVGAVSGSVSKPMDLSDSGRTRLIFLS